MLVAASICPHPPILIPDVTAGGPSWLSVLRACCLASVRRLLEAGAERLVAVGAGPVAGHWRGEAGGSLQPFGVDAGYGGSSNVLPLSLTVAAYLLDEVGWAGDREYVSVARGTSAQDCAAAGCRLAQEGADVALLVMGDGSAKRSSSAPGYLDERASDFDAAMVAALAAPDPDALLATDPELAHQLWVAGREAWQVLAGAATCVGAPDLSTWVATVRYDDAPRGVAYTVVDWSRALSP
jgi:hypothetical protein